MPIATLDDRGGGVSPPSPEPAIDPLRWGESFSGPPVAAARPGSPGGGVRRWTGTSPRMTQPRLTHHYLVLHLGGAKRVSRRGDGPPVEVDAAAGSVSIVPAGSCFDWHTRGPIDFAHVYVDPARLARTVETVFHRDPARFVLPPSVGVIDPLLGALAEALLAGGADGADDDLYLETLFEALLARLARVHGVLGAVPTRSPGLTRVRLDAVRDYVEAHLSQAITLEAMAAAAGLSRFHFHRAFRRSVGSAPHAWVTARRIDEAQRRLRETSAPLADIAAACGWKSGAQFATAFRRACAMTPSQYRAERQSPLS